MTDNVFATYDLYKGLDASKPANPAPAGGRLAVYQASDTGVTYVWSGTTWCPLPLVTASPSGFIWGPSAAANWSVRAGGQTTAISDNAAVGTVMDFGQTSAAAQGGPLPFYYQTLPGGGVSWKSKYLINASNRTNGSLGVGIAVSDGTKASVMININNATNNANALSIYHFNNLNAGSTATAVLVNNWPGHRYRGLGIRGDGTNLIYEVSDDGLNWAQLYSEAATVQFASYTAVTQAGVLADMGVAAAPFYQEHVYASVPYGYIGT